MKGFTMLDDLLGSATRARLLTVLLATPRKEHHLRELIRLVGGGSSGVQREVDRFEKLGLLQTRRSDEGRRLVIATESHPLLQPLRELIAADATGEPDDRADPNEDAVWASVHPAVRPCLDGVVDVLHAAGVRKATLFGSATHADDSAAPADLDVVVRLGGPLRGRAARYFALRRALERVSGLPVDLVEDEAVDNPYLREEIRRTGVTLVAAA
jgi:predicted nucleotidyltransferase